jgi:hypothetical protein
MNLSLVDCIFIILFSVYNVLWVTEFIHTVRCFCATHERSWYKLYGLGSCIDSTFWYLEQICDCLCLATNPEVLGSIPGAVRFFWIAVGLEWGPLSFMSINEQLPDKK